MLRRAFAPVRCSNVQRRNTRVRSKLMKDDSLPKAPRLPSQSCLRKHVSGISIPNDDEKNACFPLYLPGISLFGKNIESPIRHVLRYLSLVLPF
jgi:hypothetical protein